MIDKALLAKIRKCLALSRSANEHEAAAALAMARRLMDENGVSEAELQMVDIEESTARASRNQRPPAWEGYLCATVRRAFGVQAFLTERGDRTYIGRGAAPVIASYAFTVLFRQLKRARADYIDLRLRRCRPGRKRQRADVFCEGWASGCLAKIIALVPERIQDEGLQRYLAVRHPNLVKVSCRSTSISGRVASEDWWRGREAARDVQLNGGIGAAAVPLQLA